MNDCIKTGFQFFHKETGQVRRGDLFYIGYLFQVRGIAPDVVEHYSNWDAVVSNCIIARRANSEYSDSNFGVNIEAVSAEFAKHIEEFYIHLKPIIVREKENGKTA